MQRFSPSSLFIGSGVVSDLALRAWWLAFVIFTVIDLQLPPLQLVLLGTALELSVLVSEIPTGVVADLYSRKWSIAISFWLVGAGLALSGAFTGFWPLVATQVLWGFGYTFRSGADVAWITDHLGVAKTELLLLRRGKLQLIGSAVGLIVGAATASLTSVRVVIVGSGCLLICWGVFLAVAMTEGNFKRERGETWATFFAELRQGAATTWAKPPLRILVLVMLTSGIASESIDRLGVRRLDEVGFAEQTNEIVALTLMGIGAAALGAVLLHVAESRVSGRSIPLTVGATIAIAGICAALLSWAVTLPVAIAALVFREGVGNVGEPLVQAWTNAHASDKHRATTHSFVGQAEAMGEMSGGVLFGVVATGLSVSAAIGGSAVLLVVAGAVAARGRSLWSPS